ncbi:MAG: hypothetical protein KY055_02700 [Candidatus Nealsonbacteria bacterium]|nr:hypothetical protein [Candidatus Nealsonbacteria bacterium]
MAKINLPKITLPKINFSKIKIALSKIDLSKIALAKLFKNKNSIIYLVILAVFVFGGLVFLEIQPGKPIEQDLIPLPLLPIEDEQEIERKLLTPGLIGEVPQEEKEKIPIEDQIAHHVVNTTGIIQEVKTDRLIIMGDGQNFVDRTPRVLTIIFNQRTIVQKFGGANQQIGFKGLEQLKTGMTILIQGLGNIRGKTEFEADIINIL